MVSLDEAEQKGAAIADGLADSLFAMKELRESANTLAHQLADSTVGPEYAQRKLNIVTQLRGLVASIDEVLG